VIPLELVDKYYYHLDTCFCPLRAGTAIYYPGAFDDYGRRVLSELIPELIVVREDEARQFACNAVVLGRTVITNSGCPELGAELRRRGYEACETPLGEFVKAGGAAKCLTLRLDGEDAAAWRTAPLVRAEE
jgi:N-dimethylarginine dimethylaminohydrolase